MAELPADLSVRELRRYVRFSRTVTKFTTKRDQLKDKIKKAFEGKFTLGEPQIYSDEKGAVEIKFDKQDRFDAEEFARLHPIEKFPQFYVPTLDPKLVPATMKTPRFFKRSIVLHAATVEVADVHVDVLTGEVLA